MIACAPIACVPIACKRATGTQQQSPGLIITAVRLTEIQASAINTTELDLTADRQTEIGIEAYDG